MAFYKENPIKKNRKIYEKNWLDFLKNCIEILDFKQGVFLCDFNDISFDIYQ